MLQHVFNVATVELSFGLIDPQVSQYTGAHFSLQPWVKGGAAVPEGACSCSPRRSSTMGQGTGTNAIPLEDRYFLQKVKLGQGSFGTVWRAVDRQNGHTVAMKQLDKASLPRRGISPKDIEREVSMMRACPHENITRLFDVFEDATSIYLALEYCDGGDFGDKVKERGWTIDESETAVWMKQICAAICALHRKCICHRDIKPDNFMVSESGALKLSDFGLSIFLPRGQVAREKCGTPAFMAPELHHLPKRSPGYSFSVDMWAAGVTMYMVMFAGRHPFMSDHGHLDEHMLLAGKLDFRNRDAYNGFFAFGPMNLRFSDDARMLCKRMVEPESSRRISSEEAVNSPWLLSGLRTGSPKRRASSPSLRGSQTREDEAVVPRARSGTPHNRRSDTSSKRSATPRRRPAAVTPQSASGCENLDPNPGLAFPPRTPISAAGQRKRSKTPPPRDQGAIQEAAKLKEQNSVLQAELLAQKRREEMLVQQQKQLEEQQKLLQMEREKELQLQNEKLIQREIRLQKIEHEKKQLEQNGPTQAKRGGLPDHHTIPLEDAVLRRGHLAPGMKCRYESGHYGWMRAVVQSYNESNGTYNLDVRQQAAIDKISPIPDAGSSESWPPGTLAAYHSVSVDRWLSAVVVSFNEADGTYNLDVRDHADPDRIRARISDKPGSEPGKQHGARQL